MPGFEKLVEGAVSEFEDGGELRFQDESAKYQYGQNSADGRKILIHFSPIDDEEVKVSYQLSDNRGKNNDTIYSEDVGKRVLGRFLSDTFHDEMEEYLEE